MSLNNLPVGTHQIGTNLRINNNFIFHYVVLPRYEEVHLMFTKYNRYSM